MSEVKMIAEETGFAVEKVQYLIEGQQEFHDGDGLDDLVALGVITEEERDEARNATP